MFSSSSPECESNKQTFLQSFMSLANRISNMENQEGELFLAIYYGSKIVIITRPMKSKEYKLIKNYEKQKLVILKS
jgi:hypothetical protein